MNDKQLEKTPAAYSARLGSHMVLKHNFNTGGNRKTLMLNCLARHDSFERVSEPVSLELSHSGTGAKVLIIDNLTYLKNDRKKPKTPCRAEESPERTGKEDPLPTPPP